jgi:lysophospholipase L1-like esterase
MFSKKNLALVFISSVLSLLFAEWALRVVKPKTDGFNHHQLYCEYDSLLGWRKIPNASGHHKTMEYEVLESINSQGIRGPEYPMKKDSGERRIIVLGDSFSEGYTVGFDSLFSEVLKKKLRAAWPEQRLQVINFGTGGYSTDQELLCFERDAVQYQPDETVLMFCVNDPWFNNQGRYYSRGFKPMFEQAGDSLRLTNVPVPTLAARPFFSKIKDWLLENSELVQRLKNLRDNARYAASGQSVPDEWRIYQKEETPEMKAAWQVTARLLERLRQKTTAVGSGLTVFYIPEKIEVYNADWQEFLKTYSLADGKFEAVLAHSRLQASCDSLGIRLIDPTPVFIERSKSGPPLYFQHDWHWNGHGHALAGEVLAAFFAGKPGPPK